MSNYIEVTNLRATRESKGTAALGLPVTIIKNLLCYYYALLKSEFVYQILQCSIEVNDKRDLHSS